MTELTAEQMKITMRSILQRVATGPELSKSISLEEARLGMQGILEGKVDPVQAGLFLIALRMKRETDDEARGVLEAIRDATDRVTANVDEVVDLADPYDGFNRTLPASPFLPAVLAACGVATISHGVNSVGPKFGATHKSVLRAAGVDVGLSSAQAAQCLEADGPGWAYVDQQQFCPSLADLADFRTLIVKRQVITTVEVLAGPVVGRKSTHLVTGYVHKPYPRIYALLARQAGFDGCLLVRGVEGGVVPSLRQAGTCFSYHDGGEEQPFDVSPADLGIEQSVRAVAVPEDLPEVQVDADGIATAKDIEQLSALSLEKGLSALSGESGPSFDALVYSAALVLKHVGKAGDLAAAAKLARKVLSSGAAKAHFEAALS